MKRKQTKQEILEELKNSASDLICASCNIEKATINERKAKIEFCNSCKKKQRKIKKYRLSLKQYTKIWDAQDGKCAICDRPLDRPHIDHCHRYNHVRGILCGSCNTALGMFQDNRNILISAVKYLTENKLSRKWSIQNEKELLQENFIKDGYTIASKVVKQSAKDFTANLI